MDRPDGSAARTPRWDDLRIVLAVSRAGSVTGAARALGVSSSTVFRRVKACESALQLRLFERHRDGHIATAQGRALVALAQEFESNLAAVRVSLDRDREKLSGQVTLTTFEGIGLWVAERVQTFRERYPGVLLSLEVANRMRDVRAGHADLALWVASRPRQDLVGRRVGSVSFAVYGHRDYGPELADAHWIVFDTSRAQAPQGRWELEHVPKDRIAVRVGSRALFLDLLSRGLGVGIIPCALAASRPELRRLAAPIRELDRPLWLLYNPDVPQTARARALMDYLVEVIAEAQPSFGA